MCDEEWRTGAVRPRERFAGWDACLCFEAGELTPDGERGGRREAQGGRHAARDARTGARAHSGSAPDRGRNALLALAAAAQAVAGAPRARRRRDRLTAVPTSCTRGDAFNVVPGRGELFCDLRADDPAAFDAVLAAIPREHRRRRARARARCALAGHGREAATRPLLERAAAPLGRPIVGGRAAAPATRATSPPRSRSPSTGSARAAARRTTRASSCSPVARPARRGRAGGDAAALAD